VKREWGFILFAKNEGQKVLSKNYMDENIERCLRCGKQQELQGVAITIGGRTFHLFYLCSKCGNIGIEELLRVIRSYKEKGKPQKNS
jgi:DNA-directed RNA polymerase subunit RPC12/RpoP